MRILKLKSLRNQCHTTQHSQETIWEVSVKKQLAIKQQNYESSGKSNTVKENSPELLQINNLDCKW